MRWKEDKELSFVDYVIKEASVPEIALGNKTIKTDEKKMNKIIRAALKKARKENRS